MRIFYKIITKLMLMFCICLISDANANDTFTNLELQNPKVENQFKIAGVYWLPDYTNGIATIIDKENSNGSNEPNIPTCNSVYKYTSCPSGQKLNSECCEGKCTGCISCTASAGWDYTKPNVDNSRIRTTNQECGNVYYACNEGYQPQTNAINGINLISCPSHQNYISTGGGASCAKCEDKTCSDYGYQDNNDTTKNCSAISPYSGKNCYSCSNCPSNYVSCTSPQTGVGSPCGGKYSSCQCPTGVTNCSQGCKTYNTGACSSVCMECKTQTTCPSNQKLENGVCVNKTACELSIDNIRTSADDVWIDTIPANYFDAYQSSKAVLLITKNTNINLDNTKISNELRVYSTDACGNPQLSGNINNIPNVKLFNISPGNLNIDTANSLEITYNGTNRNIGGSLSASNITTIDVFPAADSQISFSGYINIYDSAFLVWSSASTTINFNSLSLIRTGGLLGGDWGTYDIGTLTIENPTGIDFNMFNSNINIENLNVYSEVYMNRGATINMTALDRFNIRSMNFSNVNDVLFNLNASCNTDINSIEMNDSNVAFVFNDETPNEYEIILYPEGLNRMFKQHRFLVDNLNIDAYSDNPSSYTNIEITTKNNANLFFKNAYLNNTVKFLSTNDSCISVGRFEDQYRTDRGIIRNASSVNLEIYNLSTDICAMHFNDYYVKNNEMSTARDVSECGTSCVSHVQQACMGAVPSSCHWNRCQSEGTCY